MHLGAGVVVPCSEFSKGRKPSGDASVHAHSILCSEVHGEDQRPIWSRVNGHQSRSYHSLLRSSYTGIEFLLGSVVEGWISSRQSYPQRALTLSFLDESLPRQ